MPGEIKNIAIIGANKEGLKLLPVLLSDKRCRVRLIADANKDAMLFKLNELGYRLARRYDIKITTDLNEIKRLPDLDIIINALQDQPTEKFFEGPEFKDVEKLGPLSARLIWSVRASSKPSEAASAVPSAAAEQTTLLASLREIVDAVRLTNDRKELLSVILKLATESTSAERGSIMLIARDEAALRVEIAKGMDEEVVRKIRVPMGSGIAGKVAKDGKPLLISGKASGDEFSRPMDRSDVKSAMCVPLVMKGEIIGVINVSSSESAHTFTSDDLSFLSSLAGLAAEVIHRSNEYEKLRVDSAKFTFWKDADGIMSSQLPIERRLAAVAKKLSELIPGLTCFVYVFDDETGKLFLKASSIRDAKGIGLMSLRAGEGIEGSAIDASKDVFLVDRTEEGGVKRIYMSLPMASHGELVGVFNGQMVSSQGLSVYHESFIKDIRTLIAESVYKHKLSEKDKLKARRMFAVDEAGLEIISMSDMQKLLPIIATTPAAIIGAEGSLLRVRQNGTQKFQTAATYGLDDKGIREYFLPIEKETVMEVLRRKEAVMREFSEEASPYVRSVLSYPLTVAGQIAGVLTFFNKTGEAAVYPSAFSKADADIAARFAVYAEKAFLNAFRPMDAAQGKKEAVEEGSYAPLKAFEKRVEEELNRSRRQDKNLILATMRIAGLKDQRLKDKVEVENRLIGSVRKMTRSFDVVVRLNEETYGFLFLDTAERMPRMFEALPEMVTSDIVLTKAFRDGALDLMVGHAAFPKDGDSFQELFTKASKRVRVNINKAYETGF